MMISEANMKSQPSIFRYRRAVLIVALTLLWCAASGRMYAQSQSAPTGASAFDTPQLASDALLSAVEPYDVAKLMVIFGPEGEDFISSADPIRDKNYAHAYAAEGRVKNSIEIAPSKTRATIIVGDQEWPFPVPLVKKNGKWYFDAKAGRQEILNRRIGANELDAIQVCHDYVDAQEKYASQIHDDSGVNQYAQKMISSPGKQDGLYWPDADASSRGPINETVAQALEEGYSIGKSGFHGYYFKILKGQGPAAHLGRMNYVIQGIMIGGFSLVAVPAEYGVTGIKTFIVNNDGIVYQKDLGSDSLKIAKEMELYNPDNTWQRTNDQWPASASELATAKTKP
jgi:Protein of unknown function (DUF2950)